jgi:DNA-binding SARP family transcriptional activator
MRRVRTVFGAALLAAFAFAAVVALILVHPRWPLSGSITNPLTTDEVEGLVWGGAWLLTLLLALAVLLNAIGALLGGGRRRPRALRGVLPSARPALTRRPAALRPSSAFALTVAAPQARPNAGEEPGPPPAASVVLPAGAVGGDDAPGLSIAVLGPLSIGGCKRRIKRAATHELIAYLALHPKGASRDELVEAIWPAQDPARTRPRFWQSVTEARKALGEAWIHNGDRYELDRSKLRVDVDELDCLLAASSGDSRHEGLEEALGLWRGEPLEGSDYLWADGEIRSLRATLLDLLERVGRLRLARGDARGALQTAEQAIALDGLHEPSWRLALQAEHSLGLRESITRRYDELTRSLDENLGLEPARETKVIYRQLLAQT